MFSFKEIDGSETTVDWFDKRLACFLNKNDIVRS